jgi:hypothetical protein
MAVNAPSFLYLGYLPGVILGLCLCQMQGHFEHRINGIKAPQGASFYNSAYNFIFFNDGYHVEHHMNPKAHWSQHKNQNLKTIEYPGNVFPPILGWLGSLHWTFNKMQAYILIKLENQIFHFPKLQSRIIANHKQAVAKLMFQYQVPVPSKICVIGGGGFPRSVILLRQLYPSAKIMVVDKCLNNLAIAKRHLQNQNHALERIQLCNGLAASTHLSIYDLVLVPLGFNGDKKSLFTTSLHTSKTVFLLHAWMWHSGEKGIRVSWWLLKRINYFRVKNIP